MQRDIVFSIINESDSILLDEQYKFEVIISVGIERSRDYYLKLEFNNQPQEKLLLLASLSKQAKAFKLQSELLIKEGYNIKQIVVTNFTISSEGYIIWECLSDEEFSLEL